MVSTSKKEDEIIAVGSHSLFHGFFFVSVQIFVKILENAVDKYCYISVVPLPKMKAMADSNGTQFDNHIDFILAEPLKNF